MPSRGNEGVAAGAAIDIEFEVLAACPAESKALAAAQEEAIRKVLAWIHQRRSAPGKTTP